MSFFYSPRIVTDGLVLYLDAANKKSYPGTGITLYNLILDNEYPSVYLGYNYTDYGSIENGVVNVGGANNSSQDGTFLVGSGDMGKTVNDDFTTSGWLNRATNTGGEVLSYRNASFRCTFNIENGNMSFNQRETVPTYVTNATSVNIDSNLNQWYNYSLSKSGTNFSFYRNGILIDTTSLTMTETIASTGYSIGYALFDDDYPSNTMSGSIGPIAHYTRALSHSEITQNYNTLKGRFGL